MLQFHLLPAVGLFPVHPPYDVEEGLAEVNVGDARPTFDAELAVLGFDTKIK